MRCEKLSHVWPILRNVSPVENTWTLRGGLISYYDHAGWEVTTLPILVSLRHQSANPSRDVRHLAINHFQRMLLSPQILQGATTPQIYVVFEQAIFPLIQELLDDDVHLRDPHPHGMPETRMKASTLLCRVFLYYLDQLAADPEAFTQLWLQVLDFLNGLMHIDNRHQLVSSPIRPGQTFSSPFRMHVEASRIVPGPLPMSNPPAFSMKPSLNRSRTSYLS
jgi:hypothetical protein